MCRERGPSLSESIVDSKVPPDVNLLKSIRSNFGLRKGDGDYLI